MCLRRRLFRWPCGGVEAVHAASPDAACPQLHWKPLGAAIGQLLVPFKKVIPHYQTEGVSIQSHLQLDVHQDSHMVLQQLLFNGIGKEELKFDADTFLLELNFKINSTNSIFLHQISTSSWLYICISI